jgi:hypothetical protein
MSGILQTLFLGAGAAIKDAYFNLVTLLLNTTATNGAQNNTFLDSSTNNFSITRNGNTTQGTFTPFSQTGWSNFFDGTASTYLSFPSNTAFAWGTGAYTVEGWIYQNARSTNEALFFGSGGSSGAFLAYITSTGAVRIENFGAGTVLTGSAGDIPLNTWVHVAYVRNSTGTNDTNIYVNGVVKATGTDATNWTNSSAPVIGMLTNNTDYAIKGYMSNFRAVKGTAVYTAAFTPPTTPLTNITNTSLLTCQSNRFVDNSSNNFTATPTGTTSVQAFSPFAPTDAYSTTLVGGSGYFDGNGDYLTAPNNSAWDFGSGDFTVEMWVYIISKPSTYSWFVLYGDSASAPGSSWSFGLENNTLDISFFSGSTGTGVLSTITTWNYNSWVHVAATRSGNTIRLFTNGALVKTDTYSSSLNSLSTPLYIGSGVGGSYCNGYLSGLRIIKGSALYTSAFTPPTAPPTAVTNTQLLLNYTNAGIYDAAAKNDLETVGNAQVSTTQAKWGSTSMYFDGTGDYLLVPNNVLLVPGLGDFTWEAWIYNAAAAGSLNMYYDQTGGGLAVYRNASGFIVVEADGAAGIVTSANTIPVNQWVHLATTRSGNTARVFINGVLDASATNTTNISGTSAISVGANPGGSFPFNGYIDDLRFTKGYARYTATFTPPAAPFPIQ